MQKALRPHVTAGIALVGASMIAVTPVAVPPPGVQVRPVQLVDAWSDLFTNTAANLQNIASHADPQAIFQVFSAFLTNPFGVIGALTNLTPDVTTDTSTLPVQISVDLPPGLGLGIAELGDWGATLTAINDVLPQVESNPANLFEAVATVLNGYLNGVDNISLLDGSITIPFWNGILAPLQPVDVNINLTNLIDALGLGNLPLTDLNLSNLLSQLGLGNLTLGGLFSDLGLSGKGLGDLLGDPSLGTLLSDLGLGNLGLGSFSLTSILSDLGLDTNVSLNTLPLDQILTAFGINPNVDIGLAGLLDNLGFGTFLNTGLGTELSNLGLLQGVLTDINGVLNAIPGLSTVLATIGLTPSTLLSLSNLETALNTDTVGSLLGGQTLNDSLANILTALGVSDVTPSGLTVGNLLEALGFSSATGDLSLSQLLNDLGVDGLSVGSLLNTVNLGQLLGDLGLSNLPLNLSNLGDLSNLTLGGLLGDLGLGNVANISVEPIGGLITQLVDVVPGQILTGP